MTRSRICLSGGTVTVAAIVLVAVGIVHASHPKFSWNIIDTGSALTSNSSRISVTGTRTFEVKPGNPHATGGGTWTTFAPDGAVTGDGTLEATGLVRFDLAPGGVEDPSIHAGLAFVTIEYSDGDEGILAVSCHLPGSPDSISEGISVSKGFTNYWNGFTTGTATFFQALN